MPRPVLARRRVLILTAQVGLLGASGLLAACGGTAATIATTAAAATTTAPTKTAPASATTSAVEATRAASTAQTSAALATSAVTSSAGAAASAPAKAGLTLHISSWLGQQPSIDAYKQLAATYAKVQPSVTVVQDLMPNPGYASKLTALVAGGTPPDLAETNWDDSQGLAGKGALQALDSRISLDKINVDDYVEVALELGRWPQGKSGKTFAWYHMFATSPLYYNTALFQAAGEAAPDETWTWQHLVDVAKRLTKSNADAQKAQFGFDPTYFTRTMLYSFGWDFATPDFSKCLLDSQQSLDAVQFWQDLIYKDQVTPPPGSTFAKGAKDGPFSTTRLGMQIQGSYFIERYRLDPGLEWDVAIPPSGPAGRFAIIKGAPGHSLPSQSPHADAAWTFLSWWIKNQTSDQVMLPGNMPSKRTALAAYTDDQKKHNPVPAHIELVEQIATKYGKPLQVLPNDVDAIAPYAKELDLILQNKEDVRTGMTKACQAMMAAMKQA